MRLEQAILKAQQSATSGAFSPTSLGLNTKGGADRLLKSNPTVVNGCDVVTKAKALGESTAKAA